MVSVGKEYRQTLFSAQYVINGFTNGAVVCVVRVPGVDYMMGQSNKLI